MARGNSRRKKEQWKIKDRKHKKHKRKRTWLTFVLIHQSLTNSLVMCAISLISPGGSFAFLPIHCLMESLELQKVLFLLSKPFSVHVSLHLFPSPLYVLSMIKCIYLQKTKWFWITRISIIEYLYSPIGSSVRTSLDNLLWALEAMNEYYTSTF